MVFNFYHTYSLKKKKKKKKKFINKKNLLQLKKKIKKNYYMSSKKMLPILSCVSLSTKGELHFDSSWLQDPCINFL